jgi:hypothetical protein
LDINTFEGSATDDFGAGLKVLYRAYEQCGNVKFGDLLTCLKLRALKFADRVLRSDSIQVSDGVNIVKTLPEVEDRNGRQLNLEPMSEVNEAALPTDPEEKQDKLNEMLIERLARFFQTHKVQFDMPRLLDESDNATDERPSEQGKSFVLVFILSLNYIIFNRAEVSSVSVATEYRMHAKGSSKCRGIFFSCRRVKHAPGNDQTRSEYPSMILNTRLYNLMNLRICGALLPLPRTPCFRHSCYSTNFT